MALKNLTTRFRSLKFGNDKVGGGKSNSPYITIPLPKGFEEPFTGATKVKIDAGGFSGDFPVRGGALSVLNSLEDTTRITKFFLDLPKGPIFIAKQVGLQLSNPKIETGKTLGLIENTRLYNLGINTLAQIPVNAFGIHFDRSGLLPSISEQNKYEKVVTRKNLNTITGGESDPNRLVKLYNDKIHIIDSSLNKKISDKIQVIEAKVKKFTSTKVGGFLNKITGGGITNTIANSKLKLQRSLNPKYFVIDSYVGGPGSVYGLGETKINRYSFTDNPRVDNIVPPTEINYSTLLGASYAYPFPFDKGIKTDPFSTPDFLTQTQPQTFTPNIISSIAYNYDNIQKQKIASSDGNYVGLMGQDFRKTINNQFIGVIGDDVLASTDYLRFNMESRIGIGNPGRPSRARIKINDIDELTQDKINMLPLFKEEINDDNGGSVTIDGVKKSTRDLVKFRFEAVDNDNLSQTTKIIFRAFITSINSNYSPDWNPVKYTGRGENFYTYQGTNNQVSFDFKIAAQTRSEMKPLYQKLNYLISNTYPDYSANGFMRGPFMLFTLGSWFYRTPMIINSLTLNIDDNYSWEIAMDQPEAGDDNTMAELPQILNVSMQITPIYNFIPRKGVTSPFIKTGTHDNNNWLKPSEFSNLL